MELVDLVQQELQGEPGARGRGSTVEEDPRPPREAGEAGAPRPKPVDATEATAGGAREALSFTRDAGTDTVAEATGRRRKFADRRLAGLSRTRIPHTGNGARDREPRRPPVDRRDLHAPRRRSPSTCSGRLQLASVPVERGGGPGASSSATSTTAAISRRHSTRDRAVRGRLCAKGSVGWGDRARPRLAGVRPERLSPRATLRECLTIQARMLGIDDPLSLLRILGRAGSTR